MLKKYLRLVELFEAIINTLLSVLYIFKFKVQKNKATNKCIQILGNGPSLMNDIEDVMRINNCKNDLMVVNNFATSPLYEELKPNLYCIVDKAYFSSNTDPRVKKVVQYVTDSMLTKTTWPLKLIIPNSSKNSLFHKELLQNKNISFIFFPNRPIIGGNFRVNSYLYKLNLANPLFQNVLIAALFITLKIGYKEIILWGADHSWHEDFILGIDNCIYTPDKHFYDEDVAQTSKAFKHCNADGTPLTVYEEFSTLARAFKIYHDLEYFAKKSGCTIINKSSKTWIDAFKRT